MEDNKPVHVEYVEAEVLESGSDVTSYGAPAEHAGIRMEYQRSAPSCCGGCSVVGLILIAILVWNPGEIVTKLAISSGAFMIAGWFLKVVGLHRFGPTYIFLFPPVLFLAMNLLGKVLTGDYIFSAWELLAWSLGVTLLLYVGQLALLKWLRRAGM